MIEETNPPYLQTPKFNENDPFQNEIFISEIVEEIILGVVPEEKPTLLSTQNSSNEILYLQSKLEPIRNIFIDFAGELNLNKPREENIEKLQNGFLSIHKILFGEDEESINHLKEVFENLKENSSTNPNLITIDLNESIKTRNQKKSSLNHLKENKETINIIVDEENEDDNSSKKPKNKIKAKKNDEDYKPIEEEYEFSENGGMITSRKRRAKNEIKKTTTGKKIKKDLLKEMREFTRMTQNSIEYDIFY